MKKIVPLSFVLLCVLLPSLLLAEEILVLGLFRDTAILRVDGKQYKLRVGERSPEGIMLVSADSEEAVLELNGKRSVYRLGSHISASFAAPKNAQALIRRDRGMYSVQGFINRQPIHFLVDTGASWVVLNANHARKLGINFRYEGTPGWASTASGQARVYKLTLQSVRVGDIVLKNVAAAVLEGNAPTTALLGMSFLNRVKMKREGEILLLQQKW